MNGDSAKIVVGDFHIQCPECEEVVPCPVSAWITQAQHTQAEVDNDPMWQHMMLVHGVIGGRS